MITNIHQVKECPDCASDNIVYDNERDQVICRECGLIFEPLAPSDEEAFESSHDESMPRTKAKPAKKPAKKGKKK